LKKRQLLLLTTLLGGGALVLLSPIYSIARLLVAADQGDTTTMEELVDFDSLRASINQQAKVKAHQQLSQSLGGNNFLSNGFASLGMVIANPIIDNQVQEKVSPLALQSALKSLQKPPDLPQSTWQQVSTAAAKIQSVHVHIINPNQIELLIPSDPHNPTAKINLKLQRQQPLRWQVVDAKLP
jgi:hypothetical protein